VMEQSNEHPRQRLRLTGRRDCGLCSQALFAPPGHHKDRSVPPPVLVGRRLRAGGPPPPALLFCVRFGRRRFPNRDRSTPLGRLLDTAAVDPCLRYLAARGSASLR
jgi:hypothetical protein